MGLWVQSRNQAIVISMEEPIISTPKKGKASLLKCEEYALGSHIQKELNVNPHY
jgi:hypothetical protein